MKKLLLLGGSAQQVIAIETAKRLGYYTVLCDYLPDNPGQFVADKFYLKSTTDMEAILEIGQREQIDGIIAYASDPAAPTAAYVAEKMGLPGNPYKSVDILCNKDKFRAFLSEHGFCTPKAEGYSNVDEALLDLKSGKFELPVIVKPVDSSGSKGVTVIKSINQIEIAFETARAFSRSGHVIIEDYIEKNHPYLIGGDILVVDGKVVLWGLMNCHRDNSVNPLVPVGKSYPPVLSDTQLEVVTETIQKLVHDLSFSNGLMNVELIISGNGKVFPIDIGPRGGGNMIPELLGLIFDMNIVEQAVLLAMGVNVYFKQSVRNCFYATHNLHVSRSGALQEIKLDGAIVNSLIKKYIYKNSGDAVEKFNHAGQALGILFFRFESQEKMLDMMDHSDQWVTIDLEPPPDRRS